MKQMNQFSDTERAIIVKYQHISQIFRGMNNMSYFGDDGQDLDEKERKKLDISNYSHHVLECPQHAGLITLGKE